MNNEEMTVIMQGPQTEVRRFADLLARNEIETAMGCPEAPTGGA